MLATAWRASKRPALRESRDLDGDAERPGRGPMVNTLERWHVPVIATLRDDDVTETDVVAIRRIKTHPLATEILNPRVALTNDGLTKACVDGRVQVARNVASRHTLASQERDHQVRKVLAHATLL